MSPEPRAAAKPKGRRRKKRRRLPVVGWREWIELPDLGVERIKVKVDTGARTSALHAIDLEPVRLAGGPGVRFRLHPLQRDTHEVLTAEAPLVDERWVRSSSGKATLRPVIRTRVALGEIEWPVEFTLVNRDVMGFRVLLGRRALKRRFVVDPGRSFLLSGKRSPA